MHYLAVLVGVVALLGLVGGLSNSSGRFRLTGLGASCSHGAGSIGLLEGPQDREEASRNDVEMSCLCSVIVINYLIFVKFCYTFVY